jgi:hypothetical protein
VYVVYLAASVRVAEGGMSDSYIRVIPTDPAWQPTADAAEAAVEYVAGLFAGPGDDVETVEATFHERITLIDAGEYMEDVFCPRCETSLGLDWFWGVLRARTGGRMVDIPTAEDLSVTVPCCGSALTLPGLRFEAPVGFARFEVCAVNGYRDTGDLSDDELSTAGAALGHAVIQIHTRY